MQLVFHLCIIEQLQSTICIISFGSEAKCCTLIAIKAIFSELFFVYRLEFVTVHSVFSMLDVH